ncbi:gamma-tubulin complex component 3 homolog [Anneissia japonica]|uniref:gamma-tubulin complex component 3 homolog n=1 Tax=Anneissia japonica TaxID=1529436 RepID=UPI0014257C43|nr:gamma-tubulin complex component 3 homolog [Anneissia japonica]
MATAHQAQDDPYHLLHRLVFKVLKRKEGDITAQFQHVLSVMSSHFSPTIEPDEFQVVEKIKKKLARQGRAGDAVRFMELHRKLQTQAVLTNRWAVLYLLLELNQDPRQKKPKTTDGTGLFGHGLASYATSTPYVPRNLHTTGHTLESDSTLSTHHSGASSGIGTGISSISADSRSRSIPSFLPTPGHTLGQGEVQSVGTRLAKLMVDSTHPNSVTSLAVPSQGQVSRRSVYKTYTEDENTSHEVPEGAILRELVYVFQGIDGQMIKYNQAEDAYRIDRQIGVPRAVRDQVHKQAELGWLHNKVRKYADNRSKDKTFGLVGQSFIAALQQELTEYYRLLSVLQAQLKQEDDLGMSDDPKSSLTLLRLAVWTLDPKHRMKWLALLVDYCKDKKGGALSSAIHSYTMHGDPDVRSLMRHILKLTAFPIRNFIDKWIYDGQLEDRCHEFFVAADPTVKDDRLWHERYSLRKTMIPSFLNADQASKILLIGKSINFIRQVCQDHSPINGPTKQPTDVLEKGQSSEMLFNQDLDGSFQEIINVVYKQTSKRLLDILFTKYKFFEHLKAMRRYLLLGQGDFIKHLMDLLEDDLAKPANVLYLHNVTGVLETAIRGTNAQYDDPDILKRVDVRLLEVSPGDTGWDVFSLDYHVDGPIATVFTAECIIMYLRAFNFLWRAKRMEYILAQVWRGQMTYARMLKSIPEMAPVLHQCHVLAAEMIYFVQQMQYYINFEVLECAWGELWKQVTGAEDLDHVISAHEVFLDTIIKRSLLDPESTRLLTQLRAIFDLIIQYQTAQEAMYKTALEELEAREEVRKVIDTRTQEGNWGLTAQEEESEKKRKADFIRQVVPSCRAQFRVLTQSYQDMVQKFLVMLTEHSDESLRLLAVRLDFNEIYKAKEPKLRSPMIFNKQRKRVY